MCQSKGLYTDAEKRVSFSAPQKVYTESDEVRRSGVKSNNHFSVILFSSSSRNCAMFLPPQSCPQGAKTIGSDAIAALSSCVSGSVAGRFKPRRSAVKAFSPRRWIGNRKRTDACHEWIFTNRLTVNTLQTAPKFENFELGQFCY